MAEKHIFSICTSNLSSTATNTDSEFVICDKEIIKQVVSVLRAQPKDNFLLFDFKTIVDCSLLAIEKKGLRFFAKKIFPVVPRPRKVILAVGLTRRQNFGEVVRAAAVSGVDKLVPLLCKNGWNSWLDDQSLERLSRIAVAACEQAKNFWGLEIAQPKSLENFVSNVRSQGLLLSADGIGFYELVQKSSLEKEVTLAIGPEAGFSQEEERFFLNKNFKQVSLGQTILRTEDAVLVAGILGRI